jgi:oligopeptide/dipeptide ABC transporter ATP-binding protein
MKNAAILQVRQLKTYFFTRNGVVKAVDDVSFDLIKGECLCVVGESGCGKSAAAMSILRLIDSPPGRIVSGQVFFHDEDLLSVPDQKLRQIRGNKIAMIFQDPQTALNPVFTVGDQVEEQIRLHLKLSHGAARERAIALMEQVGITGAANRINEYPHQFSGGMKQRVMIAAALSCDPEVLIADEPTTALDTTIKGQILEIFRELREKRDMSIIFITHDLGTVAEIADRIMVMYGGKIVERGSAFDIFDHPAHPYTRGLINCLPDISARRDRLTPIPGTISSLINSPEGCIFYPRCQFHKPLCEQQNPQETNIEGEHFVACHGFPLPLTPLSSPLVGEET